MLTHGVLFIADVDGVFTDDQAQANKQAIQLSGRIGTRVPFGYVTGRGEPWLSQHLLPELTAAYQTHAPRLGVVCAEYGGVILHFSDGQWHKERNADFPVVEDRMRSELRAQIAQIPGVFFDEGKDVMVSVEADHRMRDTHHDLVEEGLRRSEQLLQEAAATRPELEYQRTHYACDLVPKGMNKANGALYILNRLDSNPTHVYLLGDSASDLLLADPCIRYEIPYIVHYVGDETKISQAQWKRYQIKVSSERFAAGTIAVLKEFV